MIKYSMVASVAFVAFSHSGAALALTMMTHRLPPPNHLAIGDQYYDASVEGLRNYVESIRIAHPELYVQLDPNVSELELRRNAAIGVLVTGIVAGGVSIVYAFVGRDTCNEPQVGDPAFSEKVRKWGDCNEANMDRSATFTLLGMGSIAAGMIGAFIVAPGRSDLMQVINEHNRLSPEPMRWQVGFGVTNRMAQGALSFTF
jgi:hypothetical protein